jgi:DHA1 family multidrug resistance protein-like MFS transporter
LPPFFLGAIFAFGTAVAKDVQTIMITRFFGGFFSSAPMVNMGGVLSDIYLPRDRAAAMVGYQMSVVGGPLLAPLVGGAIADSSLSWRWTEYASTQGSCPYCEHC